jgi:hypothetical protein
MSIMKLLPFTLICFGLLFFSCSKDVTRTAITGFTVIEEDRLWKQYQAYALTDRLEDKAIIMEDYHWIDIESNMLGFLKEHFLAVELKEDRYIITIADYAVPKGSNEPSQELKDLDRSLFISLHSRNFHVALDDLDSSRKTHFEIGGDGSGIRLYNRIAFIRNADSLQKILDYNKQ